MLPPDNGVIPPGNQPSRVGHTGPKPAIGDLGGRSASASQGTQPLAKDSASGDGAPSGVPLSARFAAKGESLLLDPVTQGEVVNLLNEALLSDQKPKAIAEALFKDFEGVTRNPKSPSIVSMLASARRNIAGFFNEFVLEGTNATQKQAWSEKLLAVQFNLLQLTVGRLLKSDQASPLNTIFSAGYEALGHIHQLNTSHDPEAIRKAIKDVQVVFQEVLKHLEDEDEDHQSSLISALMKGLDDKDVAPVTAQVHALHESVQGLQLACVASLEALERGDAVNLEPLTQQLTGVMDSIRPLLAVTQNAIKAQISAQEDGFFESKIKNWLAPLGIVLGIGCAIAAAFGAVAVPVAGVILSALGASALFVGLSGKARQWAFAKFAAEDIVKSNTAFKSDLQLIDEFLKDIDPSSIPKLPNPIQVGDELFDTEILPSTGYQNNCLPDSLWKGHFYYKCQTPEEARAYITPLCEGFFKRLDITGTEAQVEALEEVKEKFMAIAKAQTDKDVWLAIRGFLYETQKLYKSLPERTLPYELETALSSQAQDLYEGDDQDSSTIQLDDSYLFMLAHFLQIPTAIVTQMGLTEGPDAGKVRYACTFTYPSGAQLTTDHIPTVVEVVENASEDDKALSDLNAINQSLSTLNERLSENKSGDLFPKLLKEGIVVKLQSRVIKDEVSGKFLGTGGHYEVIKPSLRGSQ
jgi:hypothetical protein